MPQILDLKTDLKSLKYGKDQPGGGNSGQPYIQNNINNPKDILGFDDGLVRGGAIGAARASLKDTVRIGKWLKDFPKGPLWIVKQVGLQRSNPKLEIAPGVGGLLGEPTRIYNLGINTLAQIPVGAFGVHFNRHGLAPVPIPAFNDSYLKIAQTNNKTLEGKDNRLVKLKNNFFSPPSTTSNILGNIGDFLGRIGIPSPFKVPNQVIYDYNGGPGSVYGVGRTLIRRFDNGRVATENDKKNEYRSQLVPKLSYYNTLGVSKQYFGLNNGGFRAIAGIAALKDATGIGVNDPTNPPANLDTATLGNIIINDIQLGNPVVVARTLAKNASYQTYQKII